MATLSGVNYIQSTGATPIEESPESRKVKVNDESNKSKDLL